MLVLIEESEYQRFQGHAKRQGKTLAEWAREAMRDRAQRLPNSLVQDKLKSLRQATEHSSPAPDIGQMNNEIEQGYACASHCDRQLLSFDRGYDTMPGLERMTQ